ncbi:MAG: DUF2608 domain-containing protein [Deltaproteobacteria bacterium]|nr:DUF2608 domain-containing protein [Deltaproteobacteria bacterium]
MKKMWFAMLVQGCFAFGAQQLTTDNIWVAAEKAEAMAGKYGAANVLFVSDLDNTLLKTTQDLASEPWFNWQESLLKESASELKMACDLPDLLRLFYISITLSPLRPVQEDQAQAIARLQKIGVSTIAITARGEAVASATFRELLSNGIDFAKTSLAGSGYTQPHLPYDLSDISSSGLTRTDVEKFKLASARNVVYQRGVLFSDGQNKGVLLRTLIHKTKSKIRGIVFFDNDQKNTQRVFDAYDGRDEEVWAVRASRMDTDIQRFKESSKERVIEEYLILRKLIDNVYHYPRPCKLLLDKKL